MKSFSLSYPSNLGDHTLLKTAEQQARMANQDNLETYFISSFSKERNGNIQRGDGQGKSHHLSVSRERMTLEMSELGQALPSRTNGGLFEAVRDGIVDVVNDRLNKKQTAKEINKLDQSGLSLLHQAARYNRRKVAETLLDHDACIDVRTKEEKLTPLQIAAR